MLDENNKIEEPRKGIAGLFSKIEIKSLFKKYLMWLALLEILILFVFWVTNWQFATIQTENYIPVPFPWKTYSLIAFLLPIMLTFLVGIITFAFNQFIYGSNYDSKEQPKQIDGKIGSLVSIFVSLRSIPYMVILFALALLACLIYKLPDITSGLIHIGETSLHFILILSGIIAAIICIIGVTWLIINYHLRKKNLEYQYKRDIMERLGAVYTDDGKLLLPSENNEQRKAIEGREAKMLQSSAEDNNDIA